MVAPARPGGAHAPDALSRPAPSPDVRRGGERRYARRPRRNRRPRCRGILGMSWARRTSFGLSTAPCGGSSRGPAWPAWRRCCASPHRPPCTRATRHPESHDPQSEQNRRFMRKPHVHIADSPQPGEPSVRRPAAAVIPRLAAWPIGAVILASAAACIHNPPNVGGKPSAPTSPNSFWQPPKRAITRDSVPQVAIPPDVADRVAHLTLPDVVDIALSNNPQTANPIRRPAPRAPRSAPRTADTCRRSH